MDARLKVGNFALLGESLAIRITDTDANGFSFQVQNGGWIGCYDTADSTVTVSKHDEKLEPIAITCLDQPPAPIIKRGYESILAWMRIRAGIPRPHDYHLVGDYESTKEPEREFRITCTETHTATYVIKAKDRDEAMKKWEKANWSEATDRTLVDSADITLEEV